MFSHHAANCYCSGRNYTSRPSYFCCCCCFFLCFVCVCVLFCVCFLKKFPLITEAKLLNCCVYTSQYLSLPLCYTSPSNAALESFGQWYWSSSRRREVMVNHPHLRSLLKGRHWCWWWGFLSLVSWVYLCLFVFMFVQRQANSYALYWSTISHYILFQSVVCFFFVPLYFW